MIERVTDIHKINVEVMLDEIETEMMETIERRYKLPLKPASGYRKGWESAVAYMKEKIRIKLSGEE